MGVMPLIEKLEKEKLKLTGDLNMYEEPTDSDSDQDDERFARDAVEKRLDEFQRKAKRHKELLNNFTESGMKSTSSSFALPFYCVGFLSSCKYVSLGWPIGYVWF